MLNHILTPRMKASHVAIETMREHLDAVYDITVAYEGTLTADGQRHPAPTMPGVWLYVPLAKQHWHFPQPKQRKQRKCSRHSVISMIEGW